MRSQNSQPKELHNTKKLKPKPRYRDGQTNGDDGEKIRKNDKWLFGFYDQFNFLIFAYKKTWEWDCQWFKNGTQVQRLETVSYGSGARLPNYMCNIKQENRKKRHPMERSGSSYFKRKDKQTNKKTTWNWFNQLFVCDYTRTCSNLLSKR